MRNITRAVGVATAAILSIGCGGSSTAPAQAQGTQNNQPTTNTTPTRPDARRHHSVAYDPVTQRVVVFGGTVQTGPTTQQNVGDLWSWDGARWTRISANTGVIYPGAVMFALGDQGLHLIATDNWTVYRWVNSQWTTVVPNAPGVGAVGGCHAWDSARRRHVQFGGSPVISQYTDATWEFDGAQWQRGTGPGPSARMGCMMAYDSRRNVTVMYGGFGGSALGDTWEWNGTAWTRVATTGPSNREFGDMVYDPIRGETIMFGGTGGGSYFAETWIWNGTSWRQVTGPGPAARGDGFMAFDAARGVVVLFGGDGDTASFNDTWEWNGTAWRKVDGPG